MKKLNRLIVLWVTVVSLLLQFVPQNRVSGQTSALIYKDSKQPLEKRVDDLVSRMTLEEKVSQMMNNAVAIDRLGVPAYEWWNEGLHGVARAGIATVFLIRIREHIILIVCE